MPNHQTTSRGPKRALLASLLVFLALLGVACGDDGGSDEESGGAAQQEPADETNLTIWAPEELRVTLDRVVRRYQQSRPDKQVAVVYESQSSLNDRLLQGERPDIYVGTSRQVDTLVDEGTLPNAVNNFGTDEVQIIVAPGNPKGITDLTVFDLDASTNVGLCQADLTCGKAARSALSSAQITPSPDFTAPDAKTLLNSIAEGRLDAGLLSRTQVAKAVRQGLVTAVPLPTANQTETEFQMIAVRSGGVVDDFLRYVGRSSGVKEILQNAGLADPAPAAASTTTTQQP